MMTTTSLKEGNYVTVKIYLTRNFSINYALVYVTESNDVTLTTGLGARIV